MEINVSSNLINVFNLAREQILIFHVLFNFTSSQCIFDETNNNKRIKVTHFERKNSRPDISIVAAYEITPTIILNTSRFHETKHEEVYIRIKS